MKLQGKRVLVTGGSRGIGAAIVRECATEGATVAFTYSSRKEAAEELLKSLPGTNHSCHSLDIANEESIESLFAELLDKWGSLDGLVNNAGITQDQLILRMKAEDFDKVIQTNLRGTFLCSKAAAKPMLKARKGSLVHITSVIGQTGNAGQVNYAASKAGIEAMSKSFALELASRNIRSNCIAPGFIETEMTGQLTEAQKSAIMAKIPLGRIGAGSEVARCCVFLLGEDSSYVTGHTLNVNGGMYLG